MKTKENNNLIELTFDCNGVKQYFTSENRAGLYIGKQKYNIMQALRGNGRIEYSELGPLTVKIVDGSKVPYELINNASGFEKYF